MFSSKPAWLCCLGVVLVLLYHTIIFVDAPGRYKVNDEYNHVIINN